MDWDPLKEGLGVRDSGCQSSAKSESSCPQVNCQARVGVGVMAGVRGGDESEVRGKNEVRVRGEGRGKG